MTTKRYGLYGETTRDFLTYGGQVLVHHSKPQLEFLVVGAQVRELPTGIPADQCLPIRFHPDLSAVAFDDNGDIAGKEQFRDAS